MQQCLTDHNHIEPMKTILKFVCMMLAVSGIANLSSCGDDTPENKLAVSTLNLSAPKEGGKVSFSITTTADWTITAEDLWVTPSKPRGKGDAEITVDVQPYDGATARTARIVVTAEGVSGSPAVITLIQPAHLMTSADIIIIPQIGGEATFTITSNVAWEIAEPAESWLIVTPRTGEASESAVEITIAAAPNDRLLREAVLSITGTGIDTPVNVTVRQSTASIVDALVGEWLVSKGGWVNKNGVLKDMGRYVTVEKINDSSIRLVNLMGLSAKYPRLTTEQDTFIATVNSDYQTISIAPQTIEPSIDTRGWPVYLCRLVNPYADRDKNWMQGFDDIKITDNLTTIDFSAGGAEIGKVSGVPAYGTFVYLTKDPSEEDPDVWGYGEYFFDTILTKVVK